MAAWTQGVREVVHRHAGEAVIGWVAQDDQHRGVLLHSLGARSRGWTYCPSCYPHLPRRAGGLRHSHDYGHSLPPDCPFSQCSFWITVRSRGYPGSRAVGRGRGRVVEQVWSPS